MKNDLRPAIGTVTESRHDDWLDSETVVAMLVETDEHLTVHTRTTTLVRKGPNASAVPMVSMHSTRRQKYLAIHGPFSGMRLVLDEAPGYVLFNCAERFNRTARGREIARKRGETIPPTAILVWEGTFDNDAN